MSICLVFLELWLFIILSTPLWHFNMYGSFYDFVCTNYMWLKWETEAAHVGRGAFRLCCHIQWRLWALRSSLSNRKGHANIYLNIYIYISIFLRTKLKNQLGWKKMKKNKWVYPISQTKWLYPISQQVALMCNVIIATNWHWLPSGGVQCEMWNIGMKNAIILKRNRQIGWVKKENDLFNM